MGALRPIPDPLPFFLRTLHSPAGYTPDWYGIFRPTREFFTHLETSPLQEKGCKL